MIWVPLVLYGVVAVAYVLMEGSGVKTVGTWIDIDLTGSFVFYFYAAYLALWKSRRTRAQRFALSAVLTLAPLVPLGLLDLAGVEGLTIPYAHGLTLPNVTLWLWPGMEMARPFIAVADRFRPPEAPSPREVYARGGLPQPDGSLILYGATVGKSEWETFTLLARLDAAGNLDKGFTPKVVALPQVNGAMPQPDGTAVVMHEGPRNRWAVVVQMSVDGSLREVARVIDYGPGYDSDPVLQIKAQGAVHPVPFLPGFWLSNNPKPLRVLPEGKLDEQFNAQALKVIGEQHLGRFYWAGLDGQGRAVIVLGRGLLRLDAKGLLLPPGAIAFDKETVAKQEFEGPTGVALDPNGSLFVTAGSEINGLGLPQLMRFDNNLQEDRAFTRAASSLAAGVGQFYVLGFSGDGGVIVSVVQKKHGSRILYLGPQGQLIREVRL